MPVLCSQLNAVNPTPNKQGQVVADLDLAPGKHTLTLQFANALHESYGPEERRDVSITVQ